jgi:hypothetical protein
LASKFEIKELGMIHCFSGLEVWQRTHEIFLSQGKYIVEKLKKFELLNLKLVATPMMINMKKLSVDSSNSDETDLNLYKHLIG